jgi:aspartyl-tRNA(Asn)/glutamyl-tRNA(Gln) amidotransferase subunit B
VRLLNLVKLPKDLNEYAGDQGLLKQSDAGKIEAIVDEVVNANPKAVEDIKAGEQKAIGFLIGQVMQRSKGQANPSLAKAIIEKKIK